MTIISLWLQRRVCCDLQFELTLCSLFLIILDFDATRLIKRQKLTHPLHEARAPLVATPVGVASQHVGKAGRRQLDESLPPRRNRRGDDKRRPAIDATTSGNASTNGGNPERASMVGTVGMGLEVNLSEVCAESPHILSQGCDLVLG